MFAASFGLTENPFKITPNLRFVYLGENFRRVRAEAAQALADRNGAVLLTARAGVGKSILLRLLAGDLEGAGVADRVLSLSCRPDASVDDLVRQALDRPDSDPEAAASASTDGPHRLMVECAAGRRGVVLLIDEAQNLSDHELGRLFLMVDQVDRQGGRLRLALAGPPDLQAKLEQALPSGLQRWVVLNRRLEPLSKSEVAAFIAERMETAGCPRDDVFSPDAIARISDYSNGVPRLVNTLCATALFLAEFETRDTVTAELVDEAARHAELAPPARKGTVLAPRPPRAPARPPARPGRHPLPLRIERLEAMTSHDAASSGIVIRHELLPPSGSASGRSRRVWPGLLLGLSATAALAALFVVTQRPNFLDSAVDMAERLTGSSVASLAPPAIEAAPAPDDPTGPGDATGRAVDAPAAETAASVAPPDPPDQAADDRTANQATDGAQPPPAPAIDPAALAELDTASGDAASDDAASREAAPASDSARTVETPPTEETDSAAVAATPEIPPAQADDGAAPEDGAPEDGAATAANAARDANTTEDAATAETAMAGGEPAAEAEEDQSSAPAAATGPATPDTDTAPPAETTVAARAPEPDAGGAVDGSDIPTADEPSQPQPADADGPSSPSETALVDELLEQARRQIAALALTTPEGDNAFETYQRVLAIAPGHEQALQGMRDIADKYVVLAQSAERKGRPDRAQQYYEKAAAIVPGHPAVAALTSQAATAPEPAAPSQSDGPIPAAEPSYASADPAAPASPERNAGESLDQVLAQVFEPDATASNPPPPPPEPARSAGSRGPEPTTAAARFPIPLSALESPERLRAALAAGADADTRFSDGRTPLIIAAAQRRSDMVDLLLAHGAKPNAATKALGTPLMYAVWNGDLASVEALLKGGAEVNLKNVDGKTALMAAAANGHVGAVDLLLRHGADPNIQTFNGWTALMYAVWGRQADVVDRLLESGADTSILNNEGASAASIAAERGHTEIANMLRSQQARNELP